MGVSCWVTGEIKSDSHNSADRYLSDATDYKPVAISQAGFALNDDGKWEYVGKSGAVA
jgi:hypothetical protein